VREHSEFANVSRSDKNSETGKRRLTSHLDRARAEYLASNGMATVHRERRVELNAYGYLSTVRGLFITEIESLNLSLFFVLSFKLHLNASAIMNSHTSRVQLKINILSLSGSCK